MLNNEKIIVYILIALLALVTMFVFFYSLYLLKRFNAFGELFDFLNRKRKNQNYNDDGIEQNSVVEIDFEKLECDVPKKYYSNKSSVTSMAIGIVAITFLFMINDSLNPCDETIQNKIDIKKINLYMETSSYIKL